MQRLLFWLFTISCALLFLFGTEALEVLGWKFAQEDGPFLTKLHPATYLILPTFLVAVIVKPRAIVRTMFSGPFLIFLGAATVLFIRSIMMILEGAGGGEVGAVITNWLLPAVILLCASALRPAELFSLEQPLRLFFVLNSTIAIGERLAGHRLFPNFLDITTDTRSAALVHHPLEGALLTGLILLYLVAARRGQRATPLRIGELVLHAGALFAFGGRSSLVITPILMLVSAVVARQNDSQQRITTFQRALPFVLVLFGIMLIFLPIDFVDATLDRFSNDHNSAAQRDSAAGMLSVVSWNQLLYGIDIAQRKLLMGFFQASAIELAWIAMVIAYGLIATLPMMIALPLLIFTRARNLDRSAFFMGVHFMIVTAGSLAFGVKTLVVAQFFIMMSVLCQIVPRATVTVAVNVDRSGRPGVESDQADPLRGLFGR